MAKFVTYLVTYSGILLPPYYIGSTSKEKVLLGNYFGSPRSKKWKNIFYSEIKNNKHLFSIKILSEHKTRKATLEEELRLQILNDVVKSTDYFNESLACPNGFFGRDISGKNNPFYGKTFSKETIAVMSEKKKKLIGELNPFFGKTHSNETKKKLSELGKLKIGELNPFYNKIHSKKTIKHLKEISTGENHSQAKFKETDILNIRKKYKTGNYSYSQLAKEFGTTKRYIGSIVNKETWKHI